MIRRATDDPLTSSQILGRIMYAILVFTSAWASGASLLSHFSKLPTALGYLFGVVFVIVASFALTSIRKAVRERALLWLIVSTFFFIFAYGASLWTNTHSFYVLANLEEIQKKEIGLVSNELDLISTGAQQWFENIRQDFNTAVNKDATSIREQILTPGNCGCGPECQLVLTRLQDKLGTPITPPKAPPQGSRCPNGFVTYADAYVNTIYKLRDDFIGGLQAKEDVAIDNLDLTESENLLEELKILEEDFNQKPLSEIDNVLTRSFKENNRQYNYVSNQLNINLDDIQKLDLLPESVKLKKITYLIPYMNKQGGLVKAGGLFPFALALIVDLGAFIILLRFVQSND